MWSAMQHTTGAMSSNACLPAAAAVAIPALPAAALALPSSRPAYCAHGEHVYTQVGIRVLESFP